MLEDIKYIYIYAPTRALERPDIHRLEAITGYNFQYVKGALHGYGMFSVSGKWQSFKQLYIFIQQNSLTFIIALIVVVIIKRRIPLAKRLGFLKEVV